MESASQLETWPQRAGNASAWSRNASAGAGDEGWEQDALSPIIPIITAVYSLVFVVGLLGNCLVMYVIIR